MVLRRLRYTFAVISNDQDSVIRQDFLELKQSEKYRRREIVLSPLVAITRSMGLTKLENMLAAAKSKAVIVAYEELNRLLRFLVIAVIILFIYFLVG